ncbi:hypothetical protein EAY64_04805 [Aquitalea palustris]|uniref:Uncharacterized protein n=2 Tax=Aquitalea palustris TaxID=2480983 RepID=A0A454JLB6_9NEIS|nr:hypothetical protein EAY64_04805 [Aquitalea palustris]
MFPFRQKYMARPLLLQPPAEGFRGKAVRWMMVCLDAIIEQMCGISMLCLLILLTLGFMFLIK